MFDQRNLPIPMQQDVNKTTSTSHMGITEKKTPRTKALQSSEMSRIHPFVIGLATSLVYLSYVAYIILNLTQH